MAAPRFIQASPTGPGFVETITAVAGGALNANKIPTLDAGGLLALSMLPVGVGADTQSLTASEALSSGDFVNIWNNGGVPSVRKADATTGKRADGFVLEAYASAAIAAVYFEGTNTQLTGLTVGGAYHLAAAGGVTAVIPTTSTHIRQYLGVATSTTSISVEIGAEITLA